MESDAPHPRHRSPANIVGPHLAVTGRCHPMAAIPGVQTFGTWGVFTWSNRGATQHGARLVPRRAPWRDLFAALDSDGRRYSAAPVPLGDEADAIVACCWRYGSYAAVLAAGEDYPAFRRVRALSRISDSEMQRINIEFSAGLAAWLTDRAADPERVRRRVRAALDRLPLPWRTKRRPDWATGIDRANDERLADVRRLAGARLPSLHAFGAAQGESLRRQANALVHHYYRNATAPQVADIETLHAGDWSFGADVPGFRRFTPSEVNAVASLTAVGLAFHLDVRDRLPDDDLLVSLALLSPPSRWSETDETAAVAYPGFPDTGSLAPRLRWLGERYPTAYGQLAEPTGLAASRA